MLEKIDFTKYKRFFAFGCSFTDYYWPTWANAIANEIPESYNYGKCGAGNMFIFHSLMEANIRHNIGPNDLVLIMWTNVTREDRYIDSWNTPGNIYSQSIYPKEFVKNFITYKGCLLRDLNAIHAVDQTLKFWKADYDFMSMVDIFAEEQYSGIEKNEAHDVKMLYKDVANLIKPSIHKVIYNYDWNSKTMAKMLVRSNSIANDPHPLPLFHLEYLQKTYDIDFSQNTIDFAKRETEILLKPNVFCNTNYKYTKPNIERI